MDICEIKKTIGGYIVVKADSVDEAVEFAIVVLFCREKVIAWKCEKLQIGGIH